MSAEACATWCGLRPRCGWCTYTVVVQRVSARELGLSNSSYLLMWERDGTRCSGYRDTWFPPGDCTERTPTRPQCRDSVGVHARTHMVLISHFPILVNAYPKNLSRRRRPRCLTGLPSSSRPPRTRSSRPPSRYSRSIAPTVRASRAAPARPPARPRRI